MSNSYHFITFFSCFFFFGHLTAPEILEACRVFFFEIFLAHWDMVETKPW